MKGLAFTCCTLVLYRAVVFLRLWNTCFQASNNRKSFSKCADGISETSATCQHHLL